MDIRDWPLDRIMQLPDCCLSRRFLISCYVTRSSAGTDWDISEIALPEKFVLWEINLNVQTDVSKLVLSRIALGDQLPAAAATVDALEPLIYGFGATGAEPRTIGTYGPAALRFVGLRQPISAMGRRLVLEVSVGADTTAYVYLGIVISSIPKEVPDWLISGQGRSR